MAYESFDVAVGQFVNFVASRDLSTSIRWVQPSDVAMIGRRLYVKLRADATDREAARSTFASACLKPFGVELAVLGEVGSTTIGRIYAPPSGDESERHLMPENGLKLLIPERLHRITVVKSKIAWLLICALGRFWRMERDGLFEIEHA